MQIERSWLGTLHQFLNERRTEQQWKLENLFLTRLSSHSMNVTYNQIKDTGGPVLHGFTPQAQESDEAWFAGKLKLFTLQSSETL